MNKEFSPEFTRLRQEGELGGKGLSSVPSAGSVQRRSAAQVRAGTGLATPVHHWHHRLGGALEYGSYYFNGSIGACDLQTFCAATFS